MGDIVEEIIAEPEDGPGFIESTLMQVHLFVTSYGWYILAAAGGLYYLWKNKINSAGEARYVPQTESEIAAFQAKEEARLKAVERLQKKYQQETEEKAEKMKKLDEQKKKARLEELIALDAKGGQSLGSKKSLRPEYNPLMGDVSSSRVCDRRSGGRSGG